MGGADSPTPFKGRTVNTVPPTRVLHRFSKPGHVAEIRERTITQFSALEWLLFVDGAMIESRMYHGARLGAYGPELNGCIKHLEQIGWIKG